MKTGEHINEEQLPTLWGKCPYSEFFWSIFPYSVRMLAETRTRKTPNTDTFYAVERTAKNIKIRGSVR